MIFFLLLNYCSIDSMLDGFCMRVTLSLKNRLENGRSLEWFLSLMHRLLFPFQTRSQLWNSAHVLYRNRACIAPWCSGQCPPALHHRRHLGVADPWYALLIGQHQTLADPYQSERRPGCLSDDCAAVLSGKPQVFVWQQTRRKGRKKRYASSSFSRKKYLTRFILLNWMIDFTWIKKIDKW